MPARISVADYTATLAKGMSEKSLLEQVRAQAKALGFETYHTHRSERSEPGWPDLVLSHPKGATLFRELKREGQNPTPVQQRWLDLLTASGLDAGVWRPTDLLAGRVVAQMRDAVTGR